jgi:hypothetical protein
LKVRIVTLTRYGGLTFVIPALRRLRQEDSESEASLGCVVRPCFKKTKKVTLEEIVTQRS